MERDLEEIRRIRQVGEMLELVRLVAAWTAQELNVATLARNAGLAEDTAREYLRLLEVIYVHRPVPSSACAEARRGSPGWATPSRCRACGRRQLAMPMPKSFSAVTKSWNTSCAPSAA